MAVNKNFVVKNGIEVAEDLIFANSDLGKVGIGSTIPTTTLDVKGQGIAAEDGLFTGIVTAISELNVGSGGTVITALPSGLIGLGTASPQYNIHIVRPNPEASGEISTSLYVAGDVTVTGRVQSNAITNSSEVTTANLNVTGIATVSSLEASQKEIFTQFDVVNSGSGAYQFNATGIGFTQNTNNPPLYLSRGQNYRFNVNASGHPFLIKTSPGTGTGNQYPNGVENNGAAVGIVTFKVPFDAPNTLYYQCQNHAPMVGVMIIDTGGVTGISSGGTLVGSASTINFVGITSAIVTAGIATVTFTPGISIGLAIALGG
jgi:hypothetical protein